MRPRRIGAACIAGVFFLAGLSVLVGLPVLAQSAPDMTGYGQSAGTADTRLGATLGAGSQWQSGIGASGPTVGLSFGGGARLSCSGIDLNGFLQSFDPSELLTQMRSVLLTGAQGAAANFLLMTAYANPTISSVLDMMDKRYSARFAAFAQGCNAQEARARGQEAGAKTMADAGDQCFGQEIAKGTAPTEAYRRCSIQHTFDSLDLPATASNADFLRKYTNVNVTKSLEGLLGLLPDERVDQGNYQMRPAQMTLATLSGRLKAQTRTALDRLDAGTDPSAIAACTPDAIAGNTAFANGCLPPNGAALVTSPAFQSVHLLGDASRDLFKDALSTQLAVSAMYSGILDLYQQIAQIDVKSGSSADAAHAAQRRARMQQAVAHLLVEADAQVKAQEARAQIVRSQMLALEQVEGRLTVRSGAAQGETQRPHSSLGDLVRLFTGTN